MQCPTCNTTLPSTGYCPNCNTYLPTALPSALQAEIYELPADAGETSSITASGLPLASQLSAGAVATMVMTPFPANGEPNLSGYQPDSLSPQFVPPVMPIPKGRWSSRAVAILMSLMVLASCGSFFVGLQVGRSQGKASSPPTLIITASTPTAGSTQDVNQLYQQITSRTPTFTDPLTNATLSQWATFTKPTYSCKIASDGLHIALSDTNRFAYCTSGRGLFSSFAMRVSMKLISGNGGGMIWFSDTTAGNFYYFHVYPDGSYHIYIYKDNKVSTLLEEGTIKSDSFVSGFNQINIITVIAMRGQMILYANKKFFAIIQDTTYTDGSIGLTAASATPPGEAVYTNAQIWTL